MSFVYYTLYYYAPRYWVLNAKIKFFAERTKRRAQNYYSKNNYAAILFPPFHHYLNKRGVNSVRYMRQFFQICPSSFSKYS